MNRVDIKLKKILVSLNLSVITRSQTLWVFYNHAIVCHELQHFPTKTCDRRGMKSNCKRFSTKKFLPTVTLSGRTCFDFNPCFCSFLLNKQEKKFTINKILNPIPHHLLSLLKTGNNHF